MAASALRRCSLSTCSVQSPPRFAGAGHLVGEDRDPQAPSRRAATPCQHPPGVCCISPDPSTVVGGRPQTQAPLWIQHVVTHRLSNQQLPEWRWVRCEQTRNQDRAWNPPGASHPPLFLTRQGGHIPVPLPSLLRGPAPHQGTPASTVGPSASYGESPQEDRMGRPRDVSTMPREPAPQGCRLQEGH